jgi:hypothetical protein
MVVLTLMLMLMLMSISQPRLPSLGWPPKVTSLPLPVPPHYHALPLHAAPLHSTPIHTTPQPVADLTRPVAAHTCFSSDRPPPPPHYSLPTPDVAAHHRSLHCTVSESLHLANCPMPSSPQFPCHHRLNPHAIIALRTRRWCATRPCSNITRNFTIASSFIRTACPSLETRLVSAPAAFPPPRLHILQLSDRKLDRFQVRFANLFFPRRHRKSIQPILMAQQHLVGFSNRPLRKHLSPTLAHI